MRHLLQAAIDPACTWCVELMLVSAGHCAEEINAHVLELFRRVQQQRRDYSKHNSSIAFYALSVACIPTMQVSMNVHSTLQPPSFNIYTIYCTSVSAEQACLLCDAVNQHMLTLVAMVFPSL